MKSENHIDNSRVLSCFLTNFKNNRLYITRSKKISKNSIIEKKVCNSQKLSSTCMKNLIVVHRAISRGTVISREAPEI